MELQKPKVFELNSYNSIESSDGVIMNNLLEKNIEDDDLLNVEVEKDDIHIRNNLRYKGDQVIKYSKKDQIKENFNDNTTNVKQNTNKNSLLN
jgi:phospholipid N-methyltransferase